MRTSYLFASALLLCACGSNSPTTVAAAAVPEYGYEVVHDYPHNALAFTEGLLFRDGSMWESTGQEGNSFIHQFQLETGKELRRSVLPATYFGEGIIIWRGKDGKDKLAQLTYKTQVGFVYDLASLKMLNRFEYPGEGWAMTYDGKRIIMSDGTEQLRFWDPDTLKELGRLTVTDNGAPVKNLNELEYIKGEIYANIWLTNRIARINPASGKITGWIDLTGILQPADMNGQEDVLNGIAFDAKGDRLFVTGKNWSKIYEIKLVKR